MSFQGRPIQCSACATTFTFSVEEQELFASKGFTNEPKRCPSCRQARKSGRYIKSCYSSPRQMFASTCAQCGKDRDIGSGQPCGYGFVEMPLDSEARELAAIIQKGSEDTWHRLNRLSQIRDKLVKNNFLRSFSEFRSI